MIGMGSKVRLNDKGRHKVSKEDEGKIFEVRSKPFEMFGTMCVLLKEKVGCYPIRDLTEVEEISEEGEELERYRSIGTIEECRENKRLLEFLYETINPNDMESYLSIYNASNEKSD